MVSTASSLIIKALKCLLMPWWWLHEPRAHWMHYHTWLHAATQMHANNSHVIINNNHVCTQLNWTVGVSYVHRRLSNTMSMCTGWACARETHHCQCKQCARPTGSDIYLVVQMELSWWKVVHCGQLTLHWILDWWHQSSRWANHAITRQQRIDSKVYKIELEDIVTL